MTQKILLALALSLGTASFAAPAAQACGGYGSIDPEFVNARAAAERYARGRSGEEVGVYVHGLVVDGARATAIVSTYRDQTLVARHDVRLAKRGDRWRVIRFRRHA